MADPSTAHTPQQHHGAETPRPTHAAHPHPEPSPTASSAHPQQYSRHRHMGMLPLSMPTHLRREACHIHSIQTPCRLRVDAPYSPLTSHRHSIRVPLEHRASSVGSRRHEQHPAMCRHAGQTHTTNKPSSCQQPAHHSCDVESQHIPNLLCTAAVLF
jgi:hypothetical protein